MTYHASYRGLGELLRSVEMQLAMKVLAEKVKAEAVGRAPDQAPYGEGYIASFVVESGVAKSNDGKRRAYGEVRNTSPHAKFVEFGAKNTPKYRTLGKSLDVLK